MTEFEWIEGNGFLEARGAYLATGKGTKGVSTKLAFPPDVIWAVRTVRPFRVTVKRKLPVHFIEHPV